MKEIFNLFRFGRRKTFDENSDDLDEELAELEEKNGRAEKKLRVKPLTVALILIGIVVVIGFISDTASKIKTAVPEIKDAIQSAQTSENSETTDISEVSESSETSETSENQDSNPDNTEEISVSETKKESGKFVVGFWDVAILIVGVGFCSYKIYAEKKKGGF